MTTTPMKGKSFLSVVFSLLLVFTLSVPMVAAKKPAEPKLTKLQVNRSSIETKPMAEEQLKLSAVYDNGSEQDVTSVAVWSSNSKSIVVSGGKVLAKDAVMAEVKAEFGGKKVSVKVDARIAELAFNEKSLNVKVGESSVVQLTAQYADGSIEDVTSLARVQAINNNNVKLTGNRLTGVDEGTTILKATFYNQEATLQVKVVGYVPVQATFAFVNSQGSVLYTGRTYATAVIGSDGQPVSGNVQYSSSNPLVAFIDLKGKVTALFPGKAIIKAKFRNVTLEIPVEVRLNTIESISATAVSDMKLNESQQIAVFAEYADGTKSDVTNKSIYLSTNYKVIQVDQQGKVLAKGSGTADITINYLGKMTKISIRVAAKPTELRVELERLQMITGETLPVTIKAVFGDLSESEVTSDTEFSVGDTAIIRYENGNLAALNEGTTILRATYEGLSAEVEITVSDAEKNLFNPSFEQYSAESGVADGWNSFDSTDSSELRIVNDNVADGSVAQRIIGNNLSESGRIAIFQVLEVKGGTWLDFRAQINPKILKDAEVLIQVDYSDKDFGIAGPSRSMTITQQSTGYIPVILQGQVPSTATKAWIYVIVRGTQDGGHAVVDVDMTKASNKLTSAAAALLKSMPVEGDKKGDPNAPITIWMDQSVEIADAEGISLKSGNSTIETQVLVSGNIITVIPSDDMTEGKDYFLEIAPNALIGVNRIPVVSPIRITFKTAKTSLLNGGFEEYTGSSNVADGWKSFDETGTSTLEIVGDSTAQGARAQRIIAKEVTADSRIGLYQVVQVDQGSRISLLAQIHAVRLDQSELWVNIDFSDEQNRSAGSSLSMAVTQAGDEYGLISLDGLVPETATKAWIYFIVKGTSTGGNAIVDIDDVQLNEDPQLLNAAVLSSSPAQGSVVQWGQDRSIILTMNQSVVMSDRSGITLSSGEAVLPIDVSVSGNLLTIKPVAALEQGLEYTLSMNVNALVSVNGGQALQQPYNLTFKMAKTPLRNGGFESYRGESGLADGWLSYDSTGASSLAVVPETPFEGTNAQRIIGNHLSGSSSIGIYQVVQVDPGLPISFQANLNVHQLNNAEVMLAIDFTDANNAVAGPSLSMTYSNVEDGYIPVILQGIVPERATKAWVYIIVRGTNDDGTATVDIDAVQLDQTFSDTPLNVRRSLPSAGAFKVEANKPITLLFNHSIRLNQPTAIVLKSGDFSIPAAITASGNALTVQPISNLEDGTPYKLIIGTDAVGTESGLSLSEAYVLDFKTKNAPLYNGGFELNSTGGLADGWSYYDSTGASVISSVYDSVAEGSLAQRIQANQLSESGWVGIFQQVQVDPGKVLTLQAQLAVEFADQAEVWINVDFSDANNASAGASLSMRVNTDSDGFNPVALEGVVPNTATKAWIYVITRGTSGSGSAIVNVDDVKVIEI